MRSDAPTAPRLDDMDRLIVNELQAGFPICDEPFKQASETLGLTESELISRLQRLLDDGVLSRFGPMFNIEKMQGAVTLAAMRVPEARFDDVAECVNAHDETAHNYERSNDLNMWFVLASETAEGVDKVINAIEAETGLEVYNMPKMQEFFIGLRLEV